MSNTTTAPLSAWFEMMAQALRGTSEAQEAMLAYAQVTAPDEMARWFARYAPGTPLAAMPGSAGDWPESWWRLTGFVPRIRYLEQLERNEALRHRLEEAEATITRLRSQNTAGAESQPQPAMGQWQGMFTDMVKAQNEWLQAWNKLQEQAEE